MGEKKNSVDVYAHMQHPIQNFLLACVLNFLLWCSRKRCIHFSSWMVYFVVSSFAAHLHSGELVAVKVQRPGMSLALTLDALLFHMIGGQLKRFAKARKDLLVAVNEMVSVLDFISCRVTSIISLNLHYVWECRLWVLFLAFTSIHVCTPIDVFSKSVIVIKMENFF